MILTLQDLFANFVPVTLCQSAFIVTSSFPPQAVVFFFSFSNIFFFYAIDFYCKYA